MQDGDSPQSGTGSDSLGSQHPEPSPEEEPFFPVVDGDIRNPYTDTHVSPRTESGR